MLWIWLVILGVAVGLVGTLIGAGGGFILVPILLLIHPREQPEIIACISLAVVFFNAASGSIAYARMKRIDYRGAIIFSLATMPGAILGAICTSSIPRRLFVGFSCFFGASSFKTRGQATGFQEAIEANLPCQTGVFLPLCRKNP